MAIELKAISKIVMGNFQNRNGYIILKRTLTAYQKAQDNQCSTITNHTNLTNLVRKNLNLENASDQICLEPFYSCLDKILTEVAELKTEQSSL